MTKDAKQLQPHQDEYKRLEYSLKLNLRLLNSQLTNVKMYIINTGSTTFAERFMDKTSIETIELVDEANAKSGETYENLMKNRDPTRLNISK